MEAIIQLVKRIFVLLDRADQSKKLKLKYISNMSIIKMMLNLMLAYVLRTLQHLQEGNVVVN